jgi:hypothetical protein
MRLIGACIAFRKQISDQAITKTMVARFRFLAGDLFTLRLYPGVHVGEHA